MASNFSVLWNTLPYSKIRQTYQTSDEYAVIKLTNGKGNSKFAKSSDSQKGDDYQYGDWWLEP